MQSCNRMPVSKLVWFSVFMMTLGIGQAYAIDQKSGPEELSPVASANATADSDFSVPEEGENRGDVKQAPPTGAAFKIQEEQLTAIVQSPIEQERMQQYLADRINHRAIHKSLQTHNGRTVHCVDINAQPALDNPALRGHTVQLAPHSVQTSDLPSQKIDAASMLEPLLEITQSTVGESQVGHCPDGTVPIREVTAEDLNRFRSLQDFFAKVPSRIRGTVRSSLDASQKLALPTHAGPTSQHQYAHAYRYVTNWGAQANINIWQPYTELNSEFSLGQIWVTGGSGTGLQTLEVGVQKYHDLYGDDQTHLFIYSTRDGYKSTGCYNNTCSDFVQVSSSIYPGAALSPTSVYNGAQYDLNVHWFKDMDGGAWWLNVRGQWVGYYPRSLYNASGVQNHATEIDFGGEIIDNRNSNLHTATDMGSGSFPSDWWQKAAYMRLLRYNYATTSNPNTVRYTDATELTTSRSDAACYDIQYSSSSDPNWGAYFFYGGPGYHSVNCR